MTTGSSLPGQVRDVQHRHQGRQDMLQMCRRLRRLTEQDLRL